jgi:SSS family solute:Na+ symporter
MFPEWFAGFCLAAIAVGALVPAAIMSIAAANLFTRNLLGEFRRVKLTPQGESTTAKIVSLAVKFGALAFVLRLPLTYAIELQLLGGIWTTQLFPAVVIGVFTRWMRPWALFAGWAAGMFWGTYMVVTNEMKSSVPLHLFGDVYVMYAAVPALLLNLVVSAGLTLILRAADVDEGSDLTQVEDYA